MLPATYLDGVGEAVSIRSDPGCPHAAQQPQRVRPALSLGHASNAGVVPVHVHPPLLPLGNGESVEHAHNVLVLGELSDVEDKAEGVRLREDELAATALPGCRRGYGESGSFRVCLLEVLLLLERENVLG